MPPRLRSDALRTLNLNLSELLREFRQTSSLLGTDVLGRLDDLYQVRDHRFRRVDEFTVLHVMDYEVLKPYRLLIERSDLVCIQVTLSGNYDRTTPGGSRRVESAMTHLTNLPVSISHTEPQQRLRGVWIATDRSSFLKRFGLQLDRVPIEYQAIFLSASGLPNALELPALMSNIVAAEQILACRLNEPLISLYVNAKATEIMCNIAAQINTLAPKGRRHAPMGPQFKLQAIEAAAEIYRRDLAAPPSIDKLAFRVGLNRNELVLGFKQRFGATPHAYNLAVRMEQAKHLLQGGELSFSDVARRVGYGSYSSFARAYRAFHGHALSASGDS